MHFVFVVPESSKLVSKWKKVLWCRYAFWIHRHLFDSLTYENRNMIRQEFKKINPAEWKPFLVLSSSLTIQIMKRGGGK